MKRNVLNVSDSELKTFQRVLSELKFLLNKVSDSKSNFSERVRFWNLISLRNISFCKTNLESNYKVFIFLHLYKRQFLHSACISKMH